jgi:hypothetical protein
MSSARSQELLNSRERIGMQHELAAGRAGIGADDGCLNADLWTTPALQEESTNG